MQDYRRQRVSGQVPLFFFTEKQAGPSSPHVNVATHPTVTTDRLAGLLDRDSSDDPGLRQGSINPLVSFSEESRLIFSLLVFYDGLGIEDLIGFTGLQASQITKTLVKLRKIEINNENLILWKKNCWFVNPLYFWPSEGIK